jgi:hypothetical protein
MRFPAWFAQHPRLRNGLVLLAAVALLWGGARLWTSGPDAVHITITHVNGDNFPHVITSVTYDGTIQNSAAAQRLQRDLAAMPLIIPSPFSATSCPAESFTYDRYTLTWYRAGLPVEQASADDIGCGIWRDDGVFFHALANAQTLYADIEAVVTASG